MDPDDFLWIFDILNPQDFAVVCIVFVGLGAGVVAIPVTIILRKYLSGEVRRRRCPNCRKRNAGELQSWEDRGHVGHETWADPGGTHTDFIFTVEGAYTCKECGHTWKRSWKEREIQRLRRRQSNHGW